MASQGELTEYSVRIHVDARTEMTVMAVSREAAEDKVWEQIGENCEDLDVDDLYFSDVVVRAVPLIRLPQPNG